VVLSLLASGARGDYLEDRKPKGGGPGVLRLWLGTQNDATCRRIRSVEDCIKAQGQPTRRERATPGLEPNSERRDGLDVEYIPIVLVGHGVAMLPTIVITRPAARDAIVVQYLPDDACQPSDLPFCGVDMRLLLTRIGAQVAQRYLPT